jgi:hypothetical protein
VPPIIIKRLRHKRDIGNQGNLQPSSPVSAEIHAFVSKSCIFKNAFPYQNCTSVRDDISCHQIENKLLFPFADEVITPFIAK